MFNDAFNHRLKVHNGAEHFIRRRKKIRDVKDPRTASRMRRELLSDMKVIAEPVSSTPYTVSYVEISIGDENVSSHSDFLRDDDGRIVQFATLAEARRHARALAKSLPAWSYVHINHTTERLWVA